MQKKNAHWLLWTSQQRYYFLDEIGNIPLSLQTKLLDVLQRREVRRVGGQDAIKIDVRD